MATQIVELTGDEVKLLKSLDKVIQKQVEYENRLKETSKEGKKAGDDVAGAFGKAGQSSDKAIKQYLRELKQIGPEGRKSAEALEKHLRDTGQAGFQSMDKVLDQIRAIDPEAADAAAAAQRAFQAAANDTESEYKDIVRQMRAIGPEGKAAADQIEREMIAAGKISVQSMGGILDKLAEIDPEAAKAARGVVDNLKKAETQGSSMFEKLKGSLGSYVAGYASLRTAVEGIRAIWQQINDEQDEALSALRGTEEADRRILQVSSADEFRQRTQTADNLAQEFGIDRSVVRNVQFSAISEGFEADLRTVLQANQVIDPEAAARVAGQIPQLFAGQGLSTNEALSGGLAAASRSRVDFEELNNALPKAAEGANQLGASYEETIAALAVSAKEFASVDTAGDRIKAFTTALSLDEQKRFEGLDITGSVEKLSAMTEEERRDFLGNSQELNVAFGVLLRNLDQIKAESQAIRDDRTATREGGGLLQERIDTAQADPRLQALQRENQAAVALEIQQARGGVAGADASAAASSVEGELLRSGTIAGRAAAGYLGERNVAGVGALAGMSTEDTASTVDVGTQLSIGAAGNAFNILGSLIGPALAVQRNRDDAPAGGPQAAGSVIGGEGAQTAAPGDGLATLQQQQQRQIELLEQQLELARAAASQPRPVPPPTTPALSAQQP